MKYTCNIEIDLPQQVTATIWSDEQSFSNWQDGFQSKDLLEGENGKVDSKFKIVFVQGKRRLELIETVLVNDLPKVHSALYEHIHMTNIQTTTFEALSDDKTRITSEVQYTKFNGWMPKLMAKLFPGMFKKQSEKWLQQFKTFAESK